jgi:hypothetical protein
VQPGNAMGVNAAQIALYQNIGGELCFRIGHAEVFEHVDCEPT